MTNSLEAEIQRIVASMNNEEPNDKEKEAPRDIEHEPEPEETIHIHYFPDAIVIVKEGEETPRPEQVIDTTSVTPQKISVIPTYAICSFYLFLIISCLAFQAYEILNPPIATVTIIPKSQTVTLSSTLQLGRVLPPLTISQSQTVPTTGKRHQDAKAATGTVTFYNGQQTSQTIAQGTVFTGSDGVTIETTQRATIPPGNPSIGYATVTITAQAVQAGSTGNIQAGDVNTPIATAVFVKNTHFTGGQDERDFSTVSTQDIHKISTPLKTSLTQSMQGALQGQLKPDEQLFILPCSPTVISDHPIGQEATQVKVTVSQTCSAVAFNPQALEERVTALLSTQALQKLGAGYSLLGQVQVNIKQATVTNNPKTLVFLSFSVSGTLVYAIENSEQQHIKSVLAGKTKQEASRLLSSLTGVTRASIRFDGFADDTRLPKNSSYIHILLFIL
jgi:hypothetical protein